MNGYVHIDLRIIAVSVADIKDFLQLCGVIQRLGEVGSSRKIPLVVDGDGSGKFTFYLDDEKLTPPPDIDVDNLPKIWLGE